MVILLINFEQANKFKVRAKNVQTMYACKHHMNCKALNNFACIVKFSNFLRRSATFDIFIFCV